MDFIFRKDKDFKEFKKELSQRLKKRAKRMIDRPGYTPAAVFILLLNKNSEAHVLLTKRTDSVRTHKGQVAFPGGSRDKYDKSMLATAFRETCEETGIKQGDIEILGEFDEFLSISDFHVNTFIGSIKYPYNYKINRNEITDIFEVPLSIFYNKEYDKVEYYREQDKDIAVYYYNFNSYLIWGLTARILTEFASKVLNG